MTYDEDIFLCDLDGCLTNHDKSLEKELLKIHSQEEPLYLPPFIGQDIPNWMRERIDLIRSHPGWWVNLEPIEEGFKIVKLAKEIGLEIEVASKGPKKIPKASEEKRLWIYRYIGEDTVIHLSDKKERLYGKVLFDDQEDYIRPWLKKRPRGIVIMPLYNYNKNFYHPQVLRHRWGGDFSEIEKALTWAKYRKGPMPKFK